MKKIIRIIAVAMCTAILCLTLCSCKELDEAKNNHAIFTDESKESFTFRGNTYKKIEFPSKNISVIMDGDYDLAYVTTEDVPVLLSYRFGANIFYNSKEKNPVIMQCYGSSNKSYFDRFSLEDSDYVNFQDIPEGCYVREDKYDELSKTLGSAKLDHYFFTTSEFIMEEDYMSKSTNRLADDELTEAINDTLKNGKKTLYTELHNGGWTILELYHCDKDKLITDNSGVLLFTDNQDYYLAQMNQSDPLSNDLIKVDEKYSDIFKKLYEDYLKEEYHDYELSNWFDIYAANGYGSIDEPISESYPER